MSSEAVNNLVSGRLVSELATSRPDVLVVLDNDVVDPPANRDQFWVRASVHPADGWQHGIGGPGSRSYRDSGIAIVQVFTSEGIGTGDAVSIAQSVIDIFQGFAQSGIIFRKPYMTRVGPDDGWYQINVIIPYIADTLG